MTTPANSYNDAPGPSAGEVKHADKVDKLKEDLPYAVDKTRSELLKESK